MHAAAKGEFGEFPFARGRRLRSYFAKRHVVRVCVCVCMCVFLSSIEAIFHRLRSTQTKGLRFTAVSLP